LHGPINKKVWGSYSARKDTIAWARAQATKRGFPHNSNKIHIAIDGEVVLYNELSKHFPKASFALDIRHLEEKLWVTGRAFHEEGSNDLKAWVETKREYLYTGQAEKLLEQLQQTHKDLSSRSKTGKKIREVLKRLINYMEPRLSMMKYKKLLNQDLPIASGIIEGAARYVVGERMDCSGMRWIPQRAEALLHLRCIELNGDWEDFFDWSHQRWCTVLEQGKNYMIRTNEGIDLGEKFAKAA